MLARARMKASCRTSSAVAASGAWRLAHARKPRPRSRYVRSMDSRGCRRALAFAFAHVPHQYESVRWMHLPVSTIEKEISCIRGTNNFPPPGPEAPVNY